MPNPTASDPVRIVDIADGIVVPVSVTGSGSSVEIVNSGAIAYSTTTPLGAGGSVVSDVIDTLNYSVALISVSADQASATNGLAIEFSTDGVTFTTTDPYTYLNGNTRKTYTVQTIDRYMRVTYTNGGTPQGAFNLSIQLKQFAGVSSSHRTGDDISREDDAQLGVTVIKAKTPSGEYSDIATNADGQLSVSVVTPVGSLPVTIPWTLQDGKIINKFQTYLNDVAGTGTGTYQDGNKYNMSVAAGQYYIIQGVHYTPYFSGKPHLSESTFDSFAPQTDVIKRVGYFDDELGGGAPYNTNLDGLWLESSNGTIAIKSYRRGTPTIDVDITNWSNYANIGSYQNLANWDNFTVMLFNFLWLGGAYIELRLVTPESGFVTAHKQVYAGATPDVFIKSPNKPMRYEIRSTGGAGSFRYICNQIATGGSPDESGFSRAVDTGHLPINFNVIGTKYPVLAIKKTATYRDTPIKINNLDIFVTSADRLRWTLEINPTLSAPLTYAPIASSYIDKANGNGTITVTSSGTVVASGYVTQNTSIPSDIFEKNFLSFLGGRIDGTQDAHVLTITPITTNIDAHAAINYLEG